MTKFYIIRHGESEGNKLSSFGGLSEFPLTELGRKQAELTAKHLAFVRPCAIYASKLMRTVQTAQPSAELRNMPIISDEGFNEFNGGDWEGLPYADILKIYPESYGVWKKDIASAQAPNGESVKGLYDRVNATLDKLAARHDGETVMIFTHATPIRAIMVRAMGKPQTEMTNIDWVGNASVTVVNSENGVLSLEYAGYNDHLGELQTYLCKDV